MRIAIVSPGTFPICHNKGGAVESLISIILEENRIKNGDVSINCFSIYDKSINDKDIYQIKINPFFSCLDKILFFICNNILKLNKSFTFRFLFQRFNYLHKIAKVLKKNEFDFIIIENTAVSFLCLKFHRNYVKYSGKYFYHLHNEIGRTFGCSKIIENSKKIICVSEFIKKQFLKQYPNYNTNDCVIIKNPVDNILKFENLHKLDYLKSKDTKIILFTGRLIREKGILHLLKALIKVKNQNYRLVVIGSYFFNSNIKSAFEKELFECATKLENKVIFKGYIPKNELGTYYVESDFAIFPSVWEEPSGLTMIESIKAGTPIITTNKGGISENIIEGTALLLDFENDQLFIESLARSIDSLLSNDEVLIRMKEKCKLCSGLFETRPYYFQLINLIMEN